MGIGHLDIFVEIILGGKISCFGSQHAISDKAVSSAHVDVRVS